MYNFIDFIAFFDARNNKKNQSDPLLMLLHIKRDISKVNVIFQVTLGAEMFGVGDFWLEIRVIIKILSHP